MLSSDSEPDWEDVSEETAEDSPAARERLGRFLAFEHPTLPTFLELRLARGTICLLSRGREGTPVAQVRHSRETAAALFAQAASVLLFLGTR